MLKTPVYMMPGLGATPDIFEYIKLPEDYEIYWMHWIIPQKKEKLQDYAGRLSAQIKHENPVLLGVSFGGIVIQEIAKQRKVQKLILVSTVKTHKEFSNLFKKSLRYKLYKLYRLSNIFLSRASTYVDLLEKLAFTRLFKQKMKLYQRYMHINDPQYVSWAINTLLHWRQDEVPDNFIHIHGTEDAVFPFKNIWQPVIKIKGGTHAMIIYRYKWFNENLPELLQNTI